MKYGTGLLLLLAGYSGGKMSEVTRSEFDGLGRRVTTVNENFIHCRAENTEKLKNVEETVQHMEDNITKIFQTQEKMQIQLSSLIGKILGGTAVIVALLQVISKLWL